MVGANQITDREALTRACVSCGSSDVRAVAKPMSRKIGRYKTDGQMAVVNECQTCNEWTISSEELHSLELKAALIVFTDVPKQQRQLGGAELKMARKVLGLKQRELGARLGANDQTVCRWEASEEISPSVITGVIGLLYESLTPAPVGKLKLTA